MGGEKERERERVFFFRFFAFLLPSSLLRLHAHLLLFSLSLSFLPLPLLLSCLGRCTYCKTVHARGKLGSYPLEAVVARVAAAARDPRVREVWLSSEDTGAYGRDLGSSLPQLLRALVAVLPEDGRTMLRVGMTNPPYVLSYLEELGELLGGGGGMRGVEEKKEGEGGAAATAAAAGTTFSSPSLSTSPPLLPIFRFLHVPVQSGSDAVLRRMRREYSVAEFERVAAAVHRAGATLATDVIVGFPGETAEDAQLTVDLIAKWRPRATHVSKFYPRPGTPAARWERPPAREVAARSRAVASAVDNLKGAWDHLVGTIQRVWVVDVAADGRKLVGHTRDYAQVLLLPRRKKGGRAGEEEEASSSASSAGRCLGASMGDVLEVEVTSASRWSVRGRVTRIVLDGDEAAEEASRMRLEEEEEGGGGEGQQPGQQGRGRGKAAGKGEAVVPAPRRRGASAAAAASIAAAAAASSSPTSPPPPRPETPEAPALPRSRAGKKEEEEEEDHQEASSVEAAVSTAHPSPSPSSSSALFRLLALAMLIFSFSVALALRGRAAKRGEMEETLL